jgi:hypothetical protein
MERTVDEEGELTPARDRPRTSVWLGLALLLVASCLGLVAWTLFRLDSSGIYILLAPGINALTLGASLSLLAMVPLSAGIYLVVRCAVSSIGRSWLAGLVKATGWIIGICSGLVFTYQALAMLLLTPGSSYMLQSPNDGRGVLIVNRTILHAGGFTIYEPRNWPIYVQTGSVVTNNAYDPFLEGTYRAAWNDEGLELELVLDYMEPNRYEREFIELRK